MNSSIPPIPVPPVSPALATTGPRRKHWLLWVGGSLFALLVVMVATVAVAAWWIQRPIKPVVLSPDETSVVEAKIHLLGGAPLPGASRRVAAATAIQAENEPSPASEAKAEQQLKERSYVPGSKELRLTERELNGLLNSNTELGKTLRLELQTDAINAYLAVRIPEDFPVGAGKMFRARGRFRVSVGNGGDPYAILEDVTVFGLSLPKAWLGGVKGENLLEDVVGKRDGSPIIRGIKSLQVEPGALVLRVDD